MSQSWRRFLSFANVSAVLALVIALSTGAYAITLGRNSVGHKHLRSDAVGKDNLRDAAVGLKHLRFPLGAAGDSCSPDDAVAPTDGTGAPCPLRIQSSESFTTISSTRAIVEDPVFGSYKGLATSIGLVTLSDEGSDGAASEVTIRSYIESGPDPHNGAEPEPVRDYKVAVADGGTLTVPVLVTKATLDRDLKTVTATMGIQTRSVEIFVEGYTQTLLVTPLDTLR